MKTTDLHLEESRRIVLKYGTNALTHSGDIIAPDLGRISGVAKIIAKLFNAGKDTTLVSSGAMAAGAYHNGLANFPQDTVEKQLLSGEGQSYLMELYRAALAPYGIGVLQYLLTPETFQKEERIRNLQTVVKRNSGRKKLIIVNANDMDTNAEIAGSRYTDNDPLAARLAVHTNADVLYIVSENGNLGSGGRDSKQEALRITQKHGIYSKVGTHRDLEREVEQAFRD